MLYCTSPTNSCGLNTLNPYFAGCSSQVSWQSPNGGSIYAGWFILMAWIAGTTSAAFGFTYVASTMVVLSNGGIYNGGHLFTNAQFLGVIAGDFPQSHKKSRVLDSLLFSTAGCSQGMLKIFLCCFVRKAYTLGGKGHGKSASHGL